MPKTFDATMKYLLDNYSPDWFGWLAPLFGLPATTDVKAVDADLSIVQATADKVFLTEGSKPRCLHLESQSTSDSEMPDRMLRYNVLLRDKFKCPVYSVLLLLRPQADAKSITGELTWRDDSNEIYMLFRYKYIKVWELPGLELLNGNLGLVPLAFLTDDGKGHMVEWVQAFNERADKESIVEERRQRVLILGSLLAGLRYNEEEILKAFHGVKIMKESSAYQYFFREALEEGEKKGRLAGILEGETKGEFKGKISTLVNILNSRFGAVPPQVQAKYQAVTDLATLDAAILKAFTINSPDELV